MSKRHCSSKHNEFGPALILQTLAKALIGLALIVYAIAWPFVWIVRRWNRRLLARDFTVKEAPEDQSIPMAPFVNPERGIVKTCGSACHATC
ncbi:MAG: hypothetical protein M3Q31_20625 [Actinomycetota bacterium]|nr:hypothetical protein [Actinomycetota bacterium]